MIRRILLAGTCVLIAVLTSVAQDSAVLPIVSVLPVQTDPALSSGTTVSRPLQSVAITEPVNKPMPAVLSPEEVSSHGLPSSWSRYDLLFWFPKAQPLPPLLTVSPTNSVPVLGGPQTAILLGTRSIDTPTSAGGRFTWGWSHGCDNEIGWEVTYFFTGTRSAEAAFNGTNRNLFYARPLIDARTGNEFAFPVSSPGLPGQFRAVSQNRMTGWEVNGVASLVRTENGYLNALAGYRFFLNHEGVRLEQRTTLSPTLSANAADQIDGHTRFHGGQIGLEGAMDWNQFFVGAVGKVAFGRSFEVVKIGGQTNFVTAAGGLPVQGGVLSFGSNTGRETNSAFAVLPEGQLNVGYRFRDRSKFFIGYNILYLSDAVRPGDQIDRSVSLNSIPFLSNGFPGNGTRPELAIKRTDFWVQGITIGLDYKY